MGTLGQAPPSQDHWITHLKGKTVIQKVAEKTKGLKNQWQPSFLKLGGG